RTRASRVALLAIWLYFFVAGAIWRYHVERGQFYIFVLLLLALGTRPVVRRGRQSWTSGVFFGLAASLRPSFVVMAIPLAILGHRKAAGAMVASLVGAVLLTLPVVGVRGWTSYVATMHVWEQIAADEANIPAILSQSYGEARPVPATAEGLDLRRYGQGDSGSSTLFGIIAPAYTWLNRTVPLRDRTALARVGFLTFVAAVGALALWPRLAGRSVSPRVVLAFAT